MHFEKNHFINLRLTYCIHALKLWFVVNGISRNCCSKCSKSEGFNTIPVIYVDINVNNRGDFNKSKQDILAKSLIAVHCSVLCYLWNVFCQFFLVC